MTPIVHTGEELAEETAFLSLEEYKTLRKITTTDSVRDAQLELAIEIAEDVVEDYTKRDFRTEPTPMTKKYRYDGAGVIDIDDCSEITEIVLGHRPLAPDLDVIAGPSRGPIFYWLEFAGLGPMSSLSAREMGFTSNLDTLHPRRILLFVEVTANFGWPRNKIPGSIKQAAIWLVDDFATTKPSASGAATQISAESIANLSYAYQVEAAQISADISPRIRALLDNFAKVEI
jgi:hypothetical protein